MFTFQVIENCNTLKYYTFVAKIVVTFKLEEGIYSKLREIGQKEARGVSEIIREALIAWLQNKEHVSVPDFIKLHKGAKEHRQKLGRNIFHGSPTVWDFSR